MPYWASAHEATASELRALEAIADAAAMALTNVQLWHDLQSVNRKLQQRVTEFEALTAHAQATASPPKLSSEGGSRALLQ
jgi:hypothetical protein